MKKIVLPFIITLLISIVLAEVSHASSPAELYVGAASYDITPPIGTPLGGTGGFPRRWKYLFDWFNRHPYANMFTPSIGVHDPLYSKAMILKNHKSMILFVSLDIVGVTADLYDKLKKDLKKLGFDDVVISATHTHSGSGALSKSWFWEYLAMDKFNQVVYDQFISGVMKSIELAYSQMEPANLYAGSFDLEEIHSNRRKRPGHMDNRANVLVARSVDGNRPIGGIANYAVHGMAMGGDGFLFSADISGGIERHLEKLLVGEHNYRKPTMLFVNGAEGDVTNVYGGTEGIEKSGSIFAQKTAEILPQMRKIEPDWNVRSITVNMPKGRIGLKACDVMLGKRPVNVNVYVSKKALPRTATIWQIQLGDIKIMTFPGEPTTDIGIAAKALAAKHGDQDPWIFGLTNGHLGYFVTPEEYKLGGIEPCTALHGPLASGTLLDAHETLINAKSTSSSVQE